MTVLSKFCHCERFPKISSQAVAVLRSSAEKMNVGQEASVVPQNPNSTLEKDDPNQKSWMITFQNMQRVILTCELEIRTKALTDLFELLVSNGHHFSSSFWKIILMDILLGLGHWFSK